MKELRCISHLAALREANDKVTFTGMPIVYNAPSQPIFGMFVERILPGAFDEWLRGTPDIQCLRDHDERSILGRVSAGTLRLLPQADGIHIECDMPRTTYGLDLAESIRRGDIRGMSFAFRALTDDWYLKDAVHMRDVLKAELFEVSFLANPAYPDTSAGIRGLRDKASFEREIAERMRPSNTELAQRRLRVLAAG